MIGSNRMLGDLKVPGSYLDLLEGKGEKGKTAAIRDSRPDVTVFVYPFPPFPPSFSQGSLMLSAIYCGGELINESETKVISDQLRR